MYIIPEYAKDIFGKKCPYKTQICDGLCNNCWNVTKGKICTGDMMPDKIHNINSMYDCRYPDYEDAILASQESSGMMDI